MSNSVRENTLRNLFRAVCAILAIAPLILAKHTFADNVAEARKAIQACYDKTDAATARKDINGTTSFFTADYVYVDNMGQNFDAARLRKQILAGYKGIASIQPKSTIKTLTLKGNSATANLHEVAHLLVVDPHDPSKTIRVDLDVTAQDLWIKTPNGWRVKKSKVMTYKQLIDGKPYNPTKK